MTTNTATKTITCLEHAAECASKLAAIAIKNGASQAQGIEIGKSLLLEWLRSGMDMPASQLNGIAAGRGWKAAHLSTKEG